MALDAKVGAFSTGTGTGTITVTGVGFTPKVVLFWWDGRTGTADSVGRAAHRRGFGWATGTASRMALSNSVADNVATSAVGSAHSNAACVLIQNSGAQSEDGRLDLNAFNSDGFVLDIDNAFSVSYRVFFLALGGADIINAATGSITAPGATGNVATTGVGFQPDLLLLASANIVTAPPVTAGSCVMSLGFGTATQQGVLANVESNGQNPTIAGRYCNDVEIWAGLTPNPTQRAALVSLDAAGFTLNHVEVTANARHIFWLAIKGGRYALTNLLTRTDLNNIAVSSLGIGPPVAALFASHCAVESTVNTLQNEDRWSFGAYAVNSGALGTASSHNVSPSVVASALENAAVYASVNAAGTLEGKMQLSTIDSDGFTCVMEDADASQNFVLTLAIGQATAATPSIVSVAQSRPGENFDIVGDNFGATQGTGGVTINGVTQTIVAWSNTSITCTSVLSNNRYATNYALRVTIGGGAFVDRTVQVLPAAGTAYVTLSTLKLPAVRVTGDEDIVSGDQLEYGSVVGGTIADVDLKPDGTFVLSPGVTSFSFRIHDGLIGWGTSAAQTIAAGSFGAIFDFPMTFSFVRSQQNPRRRYKIPLW